MNEIISTYEHLMKVLPVTNRMDLIQFGSFHCMLLEEWCKHNDYDVQEVADYLRESLTNVIRDKGRY